MPVDCGVRFECECLPNDLPALIDRTSGGNWEQLGLLGLVMDGQQAERHFLLQSTDDVLWKGRHNSQLHRQHRRDDRLVVVAILLTVNFPNCPSVTVQD